MMSIASGQLRSTVLSFLLGLMVLGLLSSVGILTTPATATAQDTDQDDANKPPPVKEKTNPFVHFFVSIGPWFGLIFAIISIGMVALIIILLLDLRLGEAVPPAFVEDFTDMVNKRQFKQAYEMCRNETTYVARVLSAGMGRLQYGIEDAREAMLATNDTVRAGKDSWISYLGIIGTLGPLLGLVGTVSGMVGAFRKLGDATGAPNASDLASEISHALVVTLVGVAIACPAIFFFTMFKNRLTNISANVANLADDLLTQMYHNSKKPAAPAAAVSSGVEVKR
jgi:biopolymer transport protein ExbB